MSLAKKILLPLGLIVVGVLAALVALQNDTSDYSSRTFSSLIDAVGSDFNANEARADSAPQQQVVAGWATKDYLSVLTLQAEETNARLTDTREAAQRHSERVARLIALGVGAICWIGVWMPFGGSKGHDRGTETTASNVPALPPPSPNPSDASAL